MRLSIIICVYNAPVRYLEEALRSITRSTLKRIEGDYEICMLDDGSDKEFDYAALALKYGAKYKRTENGGILTARKNGAKMATGEYAIFFDSDDTVSFNYHLPMLETAEKSGADVVINGWGVNTERAKYYPKRDTTMRRDHHSLLGDAILKEFLSNEGRQHSYYVLWNKLFKTELLLKAFSEVIDHGISGRTSYSEDAALCFFAFKRAKLLEFINTGFYLYRIHQSQTSSSTSELGLRSQIDGMSATLDMMREGIKGRADEEELSAYIDGWIGLMSRSHYSVAKGAGYYDLFPYIKEKYGVEKLSFSTYKDGAAYEAKILLGDNFNEVEEILYSISVSEHSFRVKYSQSSPYIETSIKELSRYGKISESADNPIIVIPKYKIPLKKRIIYNAYVYRLGLIFFKKGSWARNFLKRFL